MPPVEVVLYREIDGSVPLRDWLDRLPAKARDKCFVTLERLEDLGNELRRPVADTCGTAFTSCGSISETATIRMLYFFARPRIVVVSHGLIKENGSGQGDIEVGGEAKAGVPGRSESALRLCPE